MGGPDGKEYPLANEIGVWNPLTDDGDALRLAVQLMLTIDFYHGLTRPGVGASRDPVEWTENFDADPCAATRRAIVSAAAKIGKAM